VPEVLEAGAQRLQLRRDAPRGGRAHARARDVPLDPRQRDVVDYHTDAAGPHPNRKYYGIANVTYLAEHAPNWAIRNNDTYAYFTQSVKRAPEPTFTGIFADKESAGTGAMFGDLTWSELAAKAKELAPGQYLADVETYLRHGERRYTGLWRLGSGAGALQSLHRDAFIADWTARKKTEDLIDVEIYRDGGQWTYVGVYRLKAPGAVGDGGLLLDMTWKSLAANHAALAAKAYLADVETYLVGDQRRFVGVWRVGAGNGALLRHTDAKTFEKLEADQAATQQMIDFERYQTADGKSMLLGVWHTGAVGRGRSRERTWPAFQAFWQSLWPNRTMIDVEESSTLPAQVL
jgi:hypothetical protein